MRDCGRMAPQSCHRASAAAPKGAISPFVTITLRFGSQPAAALFVFVRPAFLAILALSIGVASAATLEQMTLEELARESTAVVQGRVVGERTVRAGALLYTLKTIEVARRWKGEPAETVELALPGGKLGNEQQRFGGAPLLEPDKDYVLFLWTGPSGRTQITGFSQGLCELRVAADGSQRVVRRPSSDVMLSPDGSAASGDGALDMSLTEFARRVQAAVAGVAAP